MRRKILTAALTGASLLAIAPTAALAQDSGLPTQSTVGQDDEMLGDPIVVLGSRIPRTELEGPAPVLVIDADDILRQGYQDIPELMASVTQNNGETQSTQSYGANTFTPGAKQVDLRGLGPNHTLVLVNGRRIADFPMPYGGNSNVADISNIPIGLIERVEVLSGAASAIYGSDAISGVVNFQLKQEPDGTRIDAQFGLTEDGGGESYRISGSTGFRAGDLTVLVGAEYRKQEPLWGFERSIQDSTADNPTTSTPLAYRNFMRYDSGGYYIDPGQSTCDALGFTNEGTTYYAPRAGYGFDVANGYAATDGYFCGSNEAIAYGQILSDREQINLYGAATWEISDDMELFVDGQYGYSDLKLFNGFKSWYYVAPDGNEEGLFYNPQYLPAIDTYWLDQLDGWYRTFTPEETGGFDNASITNRSDTYNITAGVRGSFGGSSQWDYEAYYNHAEYSSRMAWPEIVIDKANDFFLGQPVNDPGNTTGYQRFDADPTRLFTPLTPAEYASIQEFTVYHPKTWVNNVQATISNSSLIELPAGPVGFAAVAEFGNAGYDVNPDPKALTQYYVGIRDSDGAGTRDHWGIGGELRVPVFDMLSLTGAGRYDHYNYAGNNFGEFTYNIGAEFRPLETVLIRGAIGTGFRAPDLHYVYRGPGTVNGGGADYYNCRQEQANPTLADCVNTRYEGFISERSGNRDLLPETARSITAGAMWAPSRNFDVSVDYFHIRMENQVRNLSTNQLLIDEANCRLGTDINGNAVDTGSPTCTDALARVQRYQSGASTGELRLINVVPINVSEETTDGIDVAVNGRIPFGGFEISLGASYTYVLNHTVTQYPGDPTLDQFLPLNGYEIPRDKGKAYVTLNLPRFTATLTGLRTGEMTNWNWDGKIPASLWFNLSAQYELSDRLRISGTVNNLFDRGPVEDPSHASYPYYNSSWFDAVGRRYYMQVSYKFGGSPF
ncbi:TonB-dependent receptor domain-containing protein [Stakelama tenebrarum]|uniref:TonB-dependent receptor n=1 Tax=Stakelama tenebrarum TaxID=2711215 RepID=A0A6G6Y327_9SPHN|nr:TonB-dependent receptor [Sphingosinithalassobacter tenebrarum]QIG79332.1 TonB-dependent receptor [Sphingosinithalassobacter tenebrarum]